MGKLKLFFQSLRVRLFVIFLVVIILPGIVFSIAIPKIFIRSQLQDFAAESLSHAQALADQIAVTGYLSDVNSNPNIDGQVSALATYTDGRVILIDNTFRVVRDTNNVAVGKIMVGTEVIRSSMGEAINRYRDGANYVEIAVPIRVSASDEPLGVLFYSVSTSQINQSRLTIISMCVFILIVLTIFGVAVSGIGSWALVRPYNQVLEEIEEIKKGAEIKLVYRSHKEMNDVLDAFNNLMGGMRAKDEAQAQFVSNVSHELKTPLTSMKVLADSINSMGDEVPIEMYKEFMGDIAGEIDRETDIINDLLALVRMDKAASFTVSPTNINELLELILKRIKPIAEKTKVELVLESFRPVIADIDEIKMGQALTNLVENAVKYNKDEGWVHISLNADHQFCFIKIEDSGIGIPADSIDHIFERFYRVDKSHSSEIPGSGLGLAITQQAILLHHGEIKAYSVENEGTTFDIRFPLKYIEKEQVHEEEN